MRVEVDGVEVDVRIRNIRDEDPSYGDFYFFLVTTANYKDVVYFPFWIERVFGVTIEKKLGRAIRRIVRLEKRGWEMRDAEENIVRRALGQVVNAACH